MTLPPPARDTLNRLYGLYTSGLPEHYRKGNPEDFLQPWHTLAVSRVQEIRRLDRHSEFTWIDVGAGGGELAVNLSKSFPNSHGTAVDLHDRPAYVAADAPDVVWHKLDINGTNFADDFRQQYDMVISTAVLEHVISPLDFISALLRLLCPGGLLYMICPDYGSAARRALGRFWPYFSPGEHLAMPTDAGAIACANRAIASVLGDIRQCTVVSQPVALSYTFRYILERLGMQAVADLLPRQLGMPLPVGALETYILRHQLKIS
ncbi:MAG TPA: class I SAM-dependent methyltransferase [Dongiaceae bacterium]|nr:class I SAM-dependent methyltransferase [Dongiaceae bacterium]